MSRSPTRAIGFGLALVLAACQTETTAAVPTCVTNNPRTAGAPSTAEIAAQDDCLKHGGQACEASVFISQKAAVCLAQEAGLVAGIKAWTFNLTYNFGDKVVIWNVFNTTYDKGTNGKGGDMATFHATTGALLRISQWGMIQ